MRLIYLFLLLPFFASAQCDPEGILLELQATTDLNGLLFGETGCIEAVTIGSPLTFTGGTLDITTGNLTAGSTKVAVTGGTGAVIGAGATVDVVPGNILLSTLGGTLNLSQINQGGATLNQVMQWNGTTWAPATATATTDLTFSGASSPVTLNSSTGTDVTHTAGTGISLTGTSSNMTITNTLPDVTVSLTGAGINAVTGTYPNFTITSTEVDGSTTNELQTLSVSTNTTTLSNSGGSMTIAGGGINTVGTAGTTITITGTEVDGSISNEGSLTVGAGSGTTSIINSNTSGSTGVTITAGSGLTISETGNVITLANSAPDQTVSITGAGINAVTGTYPNFTITGTEVDGSVTNEAQTLSTSGTTSGILTLSTAGGAGGGTATIAAGTGITVAQSAGTITITNSSPATAGWLLDGNTIGSAKRIGSNDNFDVVVETNGTDRMWFDNGGAVSIGTTQSTAAQLVIKGLLSSNGVLIDAGGTLTGPTFYAATGSGSGSNATVLSGVVSMLNGNVEGLFKNTSATGTGGALLTLNTHQSATGDPKVVWTTNNVTTWAAGIDNSISGEPWKLTPNSDIGAATPAISSTTANKVGINQAAAVVTLQVTGTDAIGLPTGTTAQRSAAAIPQIRHNNTFSGLEFYDQNKGYWYRLTAISTPTVVSNTAAGTGHSGNVLAGELSSDVRGVLELNTGSASTAVGTVMTVTYASAYSGTKTVVLLDAGNDIATTQRNRFRVDTQSNTGFTIRAVTALDINETYVIKYYVGQ